MNDRDFSLLIQALREARTVAKDDPLLLAGINIATHQVANALADAYPGFSYPDFTTATGMES